MKVFFSNPTLVSLPSVDEESAEEKHKEEKHELVSVGGGWKSYPVHYGLALLKVNRLTTLLSYYLHHPEKNEGSNLLANEIPRQLKAKKKAIVQEGGPFKNTRQLLAHSPFRAEAKKQMRKISVMETCSPTEQMQKIKACILALQRECAPRIDDLDQMDVSVGMMLAGKKYVCPLVTKLKKLQEADFGLLYPEISAGRIEDEAMYYERLATAFTTRDGPVSRPRPPSRVRVHTCRSGTARQRCRDRRCV